MLIHDEGLEANNRGKCNIYFWDGRISKTKIHTTRDRKIVWKIYVAEPGCKEPHGRSRTVSDIVQLHKQS